MVFLSASFPSAQPPYLSNTNPVKASLQLFRADHWGTHNKRRCNKKWYLSQGAGKLNRLQCTNLNQSSSELITNCKCRHCHNGGSKESNKKHFRKRKLEDTFYVTNMYHFQAYSVTERKRKRKKSKSLPNSLCIRKSAGKHDNITHFY